MTEGPVSLGAFDAHDGRMFAKLQRHVDDEVRELAAEAWRLYSEEFVRQHSEPTKEE